MFAFELTELEAKTLVGILLVEKGDLECLIVDASNANDKAELEEELLRVGSILKKLS